MAFNNCIMHSLQRPESEEIAIVGSGASPAEFRTTTELVNVPRTHSTKAISNAKIKTVKLTVVVVAGYLLCSAPFVCIQLYVAFGKPSAYTSKYSVALWSKIQARRIKKIRLLELVNIGQTVS